MESHSYEPTPADIIMIGKADLFLYTGEYMEPWAEKILAGAGEGVRAVDLSAHVTLEKDDDGDGHDHGGYDPHIWTDPQNAKIMVDDIAAALCAADPENAGEYQTAAAEYKGRLDALDERFSEVVETGKRREIVFGGRFALHYFAERYGLTCISAFDSCSGETEPSVGRGSADHPRDRDGRRPRHLLRGADRPEGRALDRGGDGREAAAAPLLPQRLQGGAAKRRDLPLADGAER